ncbi:MAG: ATP-binding cassette domain-containing protein, partial [Candidatus Poribacteria bacterium]|nr:ATP-binding cassette domain-containing protein [Candidatus Poribacteria bacterium]
MNLLQLENVHKRFGDFTAVSDISFGIEEGSVYGLLGPNGAGKTTTLRMIMDIIAPDAG